MPELKRFVKTNFKFLYDEYNFLVVGYVLSESFGNEALELASGPIHLQFIRDRGQIFLDIKRNEGPKSKFYSLDLVKHLLVPGPPFNGLVEGENIEFIIKNFGAIMELFSSGRYPETVLRLKEALNVRFKWMWKK